MWKGAQYESGQEVTENDSAGHTGESQDWHNDLRKKSLTAEAGAAAHLWREEVGDREEIEWWAQWQSQQAGQSGWRRLQAKNLESGRLLLCDLSVTMSVLGKCPHPFYRTSEQGSDALSAGRTPTQEPRSWPLGQILMGRAVPSARLGLNVHSSSKRSGACWEALLHPDQGLRGVKPPGCFILSPCKENALRVGVRLSPHI